ncbi:hypothetical protein Tco_1382720 [Tanacetum coccineum]
MTGIPQLIRERPQGALPSNIIPNLHEEIKAITTRSGNVLVRPSVLPPPLSSSSKEVEREPETITNPGHNTSSLRQQTVRLAQNLPKWNPHQPLIPYPSRLNKEKVQDKSDIQVHKFFQMFKKLHFNISIAKALALIPNLAEALAPMPKYHKMLKDLLFDKEKLLGLANTSLTENCSAVLLKKLPEKLRDPGKFLIPCDFPELKKCMALVDLGRPFLRMARALVDVYGEELILRDSDEKLIFHADSSLKHPHKHGNESINMINFIDISCKDRIQEVLKIKKSNHPLSGSPTLSSDPVVESLFPSLTPFEDIDLLLEETDAFLSLDDSIPPGIDNGIYDSEGDILFLEELLNDEIPRSLSPKELKDYEPSTTKSLIKKPLGIDNEIYDSEGDILFLENLLTDDPIKDLPPHELNNDLEGDILFLENFIKDEPLET